MIIENQPLKIQSREELDMYTGSLYNEELEQFQHELNSTGNNLIKHLQIKKYQLVRGEINVTEEN